MKPKISLTHNCTIDDPRVVLLNSKTKKDYVPAEHKKMSPGMLIHISQVKSTQDNFIPDPPFIPDPHLFRTEGDFPHRTYEILYIII